MNKRQSPGFVYTVCASPDGSQCRYTTGRSHRELKHPGVRTAQRQQLPAQTRCAPTRRSLSCWPAPGHKLRGRGILMTAHEAGLLPHFADEGAEAGMTSGTCPRSHSQLSGKAATQTQSA